MCRAKSEENEGREKRRCGCDSTEKRRLRYGISLAKRVYNLLTINSPKPNFYATTEDAFTVEIVKKEIDRLYTFDLPGFRTNGNLIEQDRRLNTIGAGIEYIAATKYASPTDEQLAEAEDPAPLLEQRNEALRNALTDVGVEFADPNTIQTSSDSDKDAVNGLKKALEFYPQSWIDRSNKDQKEKRFWVSKTTGRGHYYENYDVDDAVVAELAIRTESEFLVGDGMTSNAMHEFAHRVGDLVPSVNLSERTFLMRRAGHIAVERPDGSMPKPEKLSRINGSKTESGYRDNFPDHYMGKVYEDNSLGVELFPTGMEALFTGRFGGLSGMDGYSADPDFRKFILGVIASSAKK